MTKLQEIVMSEGVEELEGMTTFFIDFTSEKAYAPISVIPSGMFTSSNNVQFWNKLFGIIFIEFDNLHVFNFVHPKKDAPLWKLCILSDISMFSITSLFENSPPSIDVDKKEVGVCGYNGEDEEITIPEYIVYKNDVYTVTALKNCSGGHDTF